MEANGFTVEKPGLGPRVSVLPPQPIREHLAKELRDTRILLGSPDTRLARKILGKGNGHISHNTILV